MQTKQPSPESLPTKSGGQAAGADTKGQKVPENGKERLDEGVEESFPASDPVSVKITK
jgi:hypothetical protein